jgi:hypothetical protein
MPVHGLGVGFRHVALRDRHAESRQDHRHCKRYRDEGN